MAVQTDSSTVTSAIDAKAINILPNPTSNPLFYAFLQAGVVPRDAALESTSTNSFGVGTSGRTAWSAISINGGRSATNDIQLDGLPVMGGGYNEAAVVPNTEGLEEVRVIANNFSAQYGHGQGVIAMSTKSGTNQYHGEVTYNLRNEALMANSRSNKASSSVQQPKGIPRSPFKVNEIGGSAGGPIIKDRLFFFTSYHFLRFNKGTTNLSTVPDALQKVGNFSQTLIRNEAGVGVPVQIFDPYNVVQVGSNLYQRAPIPNSDLSNYPGSQYAKTWYTYYPEPNRSPDDVFGTNNYSKATISELRRHNLNNRIDYRMGKHSLYGSGGLTWDKNTTPRAFGKAPLNDMPSLTSDSNPFGQIGDTIVVSPTLVVDLRYGLSRIRENTLAGNLTGFTSADYAKFGVPQNIIPLFASFGAAPAIAPGTFTGLSAGVFGSHHEGQSSHSLAGSVTKIHGSWTHKFGTEFRNLLSNYDDWEEASTSYPSTWFHAGGNFNFQYTDASGNQTAQDNLNVLKGYGPAAAFLSAPSWWIRPGSNVSPAFSQKYLALYTQNDWRASSKLTLNLGLRWDLQPGPTERYNRMSSVDLTAQNAWGSRGASAFPGVGGYSRNLWDTGYKDIGPRFGAAYQLDSATVIRGGMGITYLPSNSGFWASPVDYGASSFSSGTLEQPYGTSPNGVPVIRMTDSHPLSIAVGADPTAAQIYGNSEAKFDRHFKNGRSLQYNVFLERRFLRSWMVSAGFSASKSNNLIWRNFPINSNQLIPSDLRASWASSYIASNLVTNPATAMIANPYQPSTGTLRPFNGYLAAGTIQQQYTYVPYPILGSLFIDKSGMWAQYNSGIVHVSHSFAHGFMMDASYTFSKSITNTNSTVDGGGQAAPDVKNLYNDLHLDSSDIKHRLTGVVLFDLPIGTGKLLDLRNRIANAVFNGWQTGSSITLQTGMPIFISGASDGALITHPDRVGGVPLEVPKELQKWYDGNTLVTLPNGRVVKPNKNTFLKYYSGAFTGRVVVLPNGKYGAQQNWVGTMNDTLEGMRGPGRFNLDMTLRRNISLREHLNLEISAQATNVLNHAEPLGNYSGALGSTIVSPSAAYGQTAGMGSSDTYGTISASTYSPREVVMNVRLRF